MAEESLAHLLLVINQQTKAQEELSEQLRKLEAMMQVMVLAEDFLEFNESIIYNFLWAVSDVTTLAREKSEHMLDVLLRRQIKYNEP